VIEARDFLERVQYAPEVPAALREEARKLLRHYPTPSCIQLASLALPNSWAPVPLE
jgi:hypothetical protein